MAKKKNCLICKKNDLFNKCNILESHQEYKNILKMVDNKEDDMFTVSAEYSDEAYVFKGDFLHSISIK